MSQTELAARIYVSQANDLLGAAALSPDASLSLIEAVAEEYEHGSQAQPNGGDVA
jgi:hypothetical protein